MDLLRLGTDPAKTRVVVAMSGGVDSSVTAALLVEAGYDVVGITMQLYNQGAIVQKKGTCCAGQDIYDARRVAEHLNFPHYVFDYESKFKDSVIDDFADTYVAGHTPIPCVRCNQTVKFRDLLQAAQELDAAALVTGHYVKWTKDGEQARLFRAADRRRDQSYFLFATTQAQLNYLRFPLGDIPKEKTREHARRLGLLVADKPDSQDICFVPDGKYAKLVAKLRPGALDSGEIVHKDGRVLGTHAGIINFTVGQRRGLGISYPEPLYVTKIDADAKRVIVGAYEDLATEEVVLNEVNWLGGEIPEEPLVIEVKIRSTTDPMPAKLHLSQKDGVLSGTVTLVRPEYGVSPGQACVFYQQDRVLGGGWISF